MMLTPTILAKRFGVTPNTVAKAVMRGALVYADEQNKLIDTEQSENLDYINQLTEKAGGDLVDVREDIAKKIKQIQVEEKNREERKESVGVRQRKMAAEAQLTELKIQKMNGELVPVMLIKPLFTQFTKNLVSAFNNTAENVIIEFGHRTNMTRKEKSELREVFKRMINETVEQGVENTKESLQEIIEDTMERK